MLMYHSAESTGGGEKSTHKTLLSIIFSLTEDYEEMQPAKYSNILSAFMKIELCQFTFGVIHFEHSKKRGGGVGVCEAQLVHRVCQLNVTTQSVSAGDQMGLLLSPGFLLDSHTLILSLYLHF